MPAKYFFQKYMTEGREGDRAEEEHEALEEAGQDAPDGRQSAERAGDRGQQEVPDAEALEVVRVAPEQADEDAGQDQEPGHEDVVASNHTAGPRAPSKAATRAPTMNTHFQIPAMSLSFDSAFLGAAFFAGIVRLSPLNKRRIHSTVQNTAALDGLHPVFTVSRGGRKLRSRILGV